MAFNKIQPQQIQLPNFNSASGNFVFSDNSTNFTIDLQTGLNGKINFYDGAYVDGNQVVVVPNDVYIDSANGNTAFGGSGNFSAVTGLYNTLIGGSLANSISGTLNTVIGANGVTFGSNTHSNISIGGTPTFNSSITGSVAIFSKNYAGTVDTGDSVYLGATNNINILTNTFFGQNASINNDLTVSGDGYINQNLKVGYDLDVTGSLSVTGNASISGIVNVLEDASINRDLLVGRNANINSNFYVSGATTITGALSVTGAINASGASVLNSLRTIKFVDTNLLTGASGNFLNGLTLTGSNVATESWINNTFATNYVTTTEFNTQVGITDADIALIEADIIDLQAATGLVFFDSSPNSITSDSLSFTEVSSITLPIGTYQLDAFLASAHNAAGGCQIRFSTSNTIRVGLTDRYSRPSIAALTSPIIEDNYTNSSTASIRGEVGGGTEYSRSLYGIVEVITNNTVISLDYAQSGLAPATPSTARKRAHIIARKLI